MTIKQAQLIGVEVFNQLKKHPEVLKRIADSDVLYTKAEAIEYLKTNKNYFNNKVEPYLMTIKAIELRETKRLYTKIGLDEFRLTTKI